MGRSGRAGGGDRTLDASMATRRIPLPTSSRKAAKGALMLAITVLGDPRVREQLRRAPTAVREWAGSRRTADERAVRSRLDPTARFGQRGIERRLAAVERNVYLVFPDPADPDAAPIHAAIDELSRAAAISATMPLADRRRAHSRIGTELRRLEMALVDAVLPPPTDG
jgi:hypothetical protein